jgi:hypothetical protein
MTNRNGSKSGCVFKTHYRNWGNRLPVHFQHVRDFGPYGDHIVVYAPGATWNQKPALFSDGPVVKVLGPAREAITRALTP